MDSISNDHVEDSRVSVSFDPVSFDSGTLTFTFFGGDSVTIEITGFLMLA